MRVLWPNFQKRSKSINNAELTLKTFGGESNQVKGTAKSVNMTIAEALAQVHDEHNQSVRCASAGSTDLSSTEVSLNDCSMSSSSSVVVTSQSTIDVITDKDTETLRDVSILPSNSTYDIVSSSESTESSKSVSGHEYLMQNPSMATSASSIATSKFDDEQPGFLSFFSCGKVPVNDDRKLESIVDVEDDSDEESDSDSSMSNGSDTSTEVGK